MMKYYAVIKMFQETHKFRKCYKYIKWIIINNKSGYNMVSTVRSDFMKNKKLYTFKKTIYIQENTLKYY